MVTDRIEFLLNTNMKYGIGEFEKLPGYLRKMHFLNIAIVVDRAVFNIEYVKNVISKCEKEAKRCEILIYDLKGEPSYDYLDKCGQVMRKYKNMDVVIGIGGGSVIDLAKGIAVLMVNEGEGLKYRGFPEDINRPIPVVAVPTTAGTGSDATYNAVFTDSKAGKKLGINTTMNFPALSILDPMLIATCPDSIIASSGIDALTHAIESFVSKKATPISRMLSIEAVKFLIPNLERVLDFSEDLEIKGCLQLGAYLAGIALINSSSGPAGALSYLLGTWYKVPHGTAGAVFLPHIHRFNFDKGYYDYSMLYDAIHKDKESGRTEKDKAGCIMEKLFSLNKKFGIKEKLSSYGVKTEDIKRFEEQALTTLKPAFDLNPVEMKEDDIKELLCRIS